MVISSQIGGQTGRTGISSGISGASGMGNSLQIGGKGISSGSGGAQGPVNSSGNGGASGVGVTSQVAISSGIDRALGLSSMTVLGSATSETSGRRKVKEKLLDIFKNKLNPNQITIICSMTLVNFGLAFDCLVDGPSLDDGLLALLKRLFDDKPPTKLYVELSDIWSDGVGYCEYVGIDMTRVIRFYLDDELAVDIGGVCRECFTAVFE